MRPETASRRRRAKAPTTSGDNPFLHFLGEIKGQTDRRLDRLLDRRMARAQRIAPEVASLVAALADLCRRGGKRLRPALVATGYRAGSARGSLDAALDAGAALELVQAYFLIHDDWMDGDETRRGGPSVHRLLARSLGSRARGGFGAILAGDYAAALALHALSALRVPAATWPALLDCFAEMQLAAVAGQQLDLAGGANDVELTYALKTGSYTVEGPLKLGAILAGAPPATLRALERFARPLGIAFQLADDLLGAFGDPKATGKPLGGDVLSGKRTLLLHEGLRLARGKDQKLLQRVVDRPGVERRELVAALAALERSGARARIQARIERLAMQARRAISPAISPQAAVLLEGAVEALTRRLS